MSMDAELYARVRKLEKQVEALLERHPEVRAVLGRETMMDADQGSIDTKFPCDMCGAILDGDIDGYVSHHRKRMCEPCADKRATTRRIVPHLPPSGPEDNPIAPGTIQRG